MTFVCYPKCSTCQKAQKWLDLRSVSYTLRDIKQDPPTMDELRIWHHNSGLELRKFFNTNGLVYKSLQLKDKLPSMNEEDQLRLLSSDGMLVKRPLLVGKDIFLVGFNQTQWGQIL